MLREQIEALELQSRVIEKEVALNELSIKEDKKKLALLKAATKRLVDLEEQLGEPTIVSI